MKSLETNRGGADWITTGPGDDVDRRRLRQRHDLYAGDGRNLVFGDSGDSTSVPGSVLLQADSLDYANGGEDWITTGTGTGRDIIVGGADKDHIVAGGGDNVIAGDNASMTFDVNGVLHVFKTIAPGIGGNDDVTLRRATTSSSAAPVGTRSRSATATTSSSATTAS